MGDIFGSFAYLITYNIKNIYGTKEKIKRINESLSYSSFHFSIYKVPDKNKIN